MRNLKQLAPRDATDWENREVRRTKRLNINLPVEIFEELEALAKESGRTLTELVRLALGLVNLALSEYKAGNRLAVLDARGKTVKEVLLPR